MAVPKDLKDVFTLLSEISTKLAQIESHTTKIPKVEKRIAAIEKDIATIKQCVSTENADEFPALVRGGGSSAKGSGIAMAAMGKH